MHARILKRMITNRVNKCFSIQIKFPENKSFVLEPLVLPSKIDMKVQNFILAKITFLKEIIAILHVRF